ncbi:hypothetical protein FE782_18350 [Paenibacillus antri]|uniref:Cbb3-type cytochrome c oxidase subunit I n=1 Tax=Paenibacillus antri TaxID=2582848 RepID=A0A5R9G2U1_9BACL|nr:hypothetical protein [Paenibacillus antri]TLS50667.1 hypothetical protein FE782_18350 [Paenibacillus antri]
MFRLPLLFIATGIVGFVLYHALSLLTLGTWMFEPIRNPDGWFRVHLLVLDWATMIAMGAVYQLMDVVLQRRIYSMKLGYLHYAVFTAGTIALLYGFVASDVPFLAGGALLALTGVVLFAWNVGATMLQARVWNPVTASTACALIYLVVTAVMGTVMGLNFAFPVWIEGHDRLLASHIWIGMLGWFGLLITGFSYKMLPMFYLSHGFSARLQYPVIALLNAGVLTGAVSFLFGGGGAAQAASVAVVAAAFVVYAAHIAEVRKHKHKSSPGRGIWWTVQSAHALAFFGAALLATWLLFPGAFEGRQTTMVIGMFYMWGWVSMTVLGYLSKIVPFLWWTHKYGPRAGQPNVPTMAMMIPDAAVGYGLACVAAGLCIALAGIYFESKVWVGAGGTALSVGSILYMSVIVRVFSR